MWRDPITEATFRTQVLLDANLEPDGLLVASQGALIAGFVLALRRRVPVPVAGLESDKAWITAFGVHPDLRRRGIATALFAEAERRLAGRQLLISPYTPNYFIPGVDVDAYPEALCFLERRGWQRGSEPISMKAELDGFATSSVAAESEIRLLQQEQIEIRPVQSRDIPELMAVIGGEFGWDWQRMAQESLLEIMGRSSDERGMLVAARGREILGYCQHNRERFGPFGVLPAHRGRGIGRALLERCLAAMAARGFHCAWFLWTGRNAARIYERVGFRQVRQFVIMSKPASEEAKEAEA